MKPESKLLQDKSDVPFVIKCHLLNGYSQTPSFWVKGGCGLKNFVIFVLSDHFLNNLL